MRGMTIAVCNEYFMQLQKKNCDGNITTEHRQRRHYATMWRHNTLYLATKHLICRRRHCGHTCHKCITNQHQNINITWTCTLGAIFGKQHKTAGPEMHGLLCAWFSNIRLLCTNCHLLRQTNEKRTIDANNTTAAIISSFTWQWWHQIDNIIVCCTMGVPVMGILTRNNIIFINNTIILVVNKQILRHNLLDVQLDTWTRSRIRNPTIYANCFFFCQLYTFAYLLCNLHRSIEQHNFKLVQQKWSVLTDSSPIFAIIPCSFTTQFGNGL